MWISRVIGAVIGSGILVVLFLLFSPYPTYERITIVFASRPVQIATIDTKSQQVIILQVPEDVAIEGAFALGRYPIASFWKMGGLDTNDRPLLALSIQNAFGIPIDGYIGQKYDQLFEVDDPISTVRDTFSFSGLLKIISNRTVTNISLWKLFALHKSLGSIRNSDIKVIDVGASMSTFEEELPDNTIRHVLDPQRIDMLIKNAFVYASVRKEALSIGVNNTTTVLDLARTTARQLVNSGAFVVSVGSDDGPRARCEMTGDLKSLKSRTADFIRTHFSCTDAPTVIAQREDLIVHLGTEIGVLYSPRNVSD